MVESYSWKLNYPKKAELSFGDNIEAETLLLNMLAVSPLSKF